MSPLDLLFWSAHAALSSVALTIIVRNAPWVRGWVQQAKKPWACNVCMPLYTTAAAVGGTAYLQGSWFVALAYLPAYVLSHVALEKMSEPPSEPFVPTDFLETSDTNATTATDNT